MFFFPAQFSTAGAVIVWLEEVLLFAVLSWVFYSLSKGRAAAWGDMVKGAFDLYRWDLLTQMGFKSAPATSATEHTLWEDIGQCMYFAGDVTSPEPPYIAASEPAVGATGKRQNVQVSLPIQRSVRVGPAFSLRRRQRVTIVLEVKNDGTAPATDVTVTDTVPEGFDREWRSERCAGHGLTIDGANPYHFHVAGAIPADENIVLSYRAIPRTAN